MGRAFADGDHKSILPPAYVVCGKVLFPVLSVGLSVYPREGGSHVNYHLAPFPLPRHDPLPLPRDTPPWPQTHSPKTCSNLFTSGPLPTYWQAGSWPSTERPSCKLCACLLTVENPTLLCRFRI